MKTIRAYGHGFLLRRGLLNIGRNYKTGNWAIELRWSWGYIPAWSLRLYLGQVKPSRERIRFCHVISPLFMVLHWLVAIPVYLIAYGALFAGLGLLVGLGRLLVLFMCFKDFSLCRFFRSFRFLLRLRPGVVIYQYVHNASDPDPFNAVVRYAVVRDVKSNCAGLMWVSYCMCDDIVAYSDFVSSDFPLMFSKNDMRTSAAHSLISSSWRFSDKCVE